MSRFRTGLVGGRGFLGYQRGERGSGVTFWKNILWGRFRCLLLLLFLLLQSRYRSQQFATSIAELSSRHARSLQSRPQDLGDSSLGLFGGGSRHETEFEVAIMIGMVAIVVVAAAAHGGMHYIELTTIAARLSRWQMRWYIIVCHD